MPTLGNTTLTEADWQKILPGGFFTDSISKFMDGMAGLMTLRSLPSFKINLPMGGLVKQRHSHELITPSVPVLSHFGFTQTVDGRFFYEDECLNHLSLNSKHGQFFSKLLMNEHNYISDKDMLQILGFNEYRNLGYVRRDMKNALRQDRFEIVLHRSKGQGYRLIDLKQV